jgi:hypothetical protein
MAEATPITQLTIDGIPTPFEQCALHVEGDTWWVEVVGMYEAYGVPNKKGHDVPVSFDIAEGRHAGMARISSVEHEDHTEERMVVRLDGLKPLR